MPKFISLIPTAKASITPFSTSTIALSSSPVALTKTVEPSAMPTKQITPSPTTLPSEITDSKGVHMVLVSAGEFTMGRDTGVDDEKPTHTVNLDAYYIDIYEVTNELYKACVNAGTCRPPNRSDLQGPIVSEDYFEGTGAYTYVVNDYYDSIEYQTYPVVSIDWSMAKTYCEWRDARLPTEAEWEKAARGVDNLVYPWGNDFDCHSGNFFDFSGSWYDRYEPEHPKAGDWVVGPSCDSYIGASPVGEFSLGSSSYGLYDLSGNVWEWVSSLYKPYPYKYDASENSQETGLRVFRGGSFYTGGNSSQASIRRSAQENYSAMDLGFRCTSSP